MNLFYKRYVKSKRESSMQFYFKGMKGGQVERYNSGKKLFNPLYIEYKIDLYHQKVIIVKYTPLCGLDYKDLHFVWIKEIVYYRKLYVNYLFYLVFYTF